MLGALTTFLTAFAGIALATVARAGTPAMEMTERIDRAVRSGREHLMEQIPALVARTPVEYPMGKLALPLAAVLTAGAPTGDARVQAALRKLEPMPPDRTYSVVCYLLALDSLCERQREEADAAGTAPPEAGSVGTSLRATGKVRSEMEELTAWLVAAQNRGHGSWTYGKGGTRRQHDFSNTQFAALGLEIAARHGIEVPEETWQQLAACLCRAAAREEAPVSFEVTLERSLEDRLRATSVSPVERYTLPPAGWAYTDGGARKGSRPEPYASMTAAGASSLLIAVQALDARKGGRAPPEAERLIRAAYAWMAGHFADYLTDPRHLYYTLYSLEKVGDLGSLEKLGSHDWYQEGASVILERQGKDGGWGSYVHTSFALLFLTRATRRLGISSAPTLFTGRKGPEGDLVYIEKLGGFVSARKLLRHAAERRSPQLSATVAEAVRNYPPDREAELVPCLLALWGKPDALTSIARRELRRITGVQDGGPGSYVRWLEDLGKIRALEARADATAEEMSLLLRSVEPVKLKCRIVGLVGNRGLRALTGLLVEEMAVPSAEYRERIHGVLSLWVADAVRPPSRRDASDWERIAEEWRAWWLRNQGGSLQ